MAVQRWTIVKIGGVSAESIRTQFQRWEKQSEKIAQSDDGKWEETDLAAIERFVGTLRSHATDLPIIFFSEHVDMWSVGNSLFSFFSQTPGYYFVDAGYSLACLDVNAQMALANKVHKSARDESLTREDRWFLSNVVNAFEAWHALVSNSVIIVIREAFRASALDEDVIAACATVPNWL